MLEQLDAFIAGLDSAAFLGALGGAALAEYVFPPFPGDSVALLGGVLAVRGQKTWIGVYAALMAGGTLGMVFQYALGVRLAGYFQRHPSARIAFIDGERLAALRLQMAKSGPWLIVLNRFVPAARALVFLAAGAGGMKLGKALAFGVVSGAAWNALLLGTGMALGGNLELLRRLLGRYEQVVLWVLVVAAVVLLVRWRMRARAQGGDVV